MDGLRQRVVGALAPLVDPMLATFASQDREPPSVDAYRELLAGEANVYSNEPAALDHDRRAARMDSSYVFPLLRFALLAWNMTDELHFDSAVAVLRPRRARRVLAEGEFRNDGHRAPPRDRRNAAALRAVSGADQTARVIVGVIDNTR